MNSQDLLNAFRDPIIVTVCYFLLYYVFLLRIPKIKFALMKSIRENWKKENPQGRLGGAELHRLMQLDPQMYEVARAQLNMLEQMPPFLFSFWLYVIFVDARIGAILGGVYTGFRAFYPFFYGTNALLLITVPNYLVILYFLFAVLFKALF